MKFLKKYWAQICLVVAAVLYWYSFWHLGILSVSRVPKINYDKPSFQGSAWAPDVKLTNNSIVTKAVVSQKCYIFLYDKVCK